MRADLYNKNSNSYRDETQSELDFLDGATAGSVVNSKSLIYGAAGQVAATTLTVSGNVTLGDASTDAHVVNGSLVGMQMLTESSAADDDLTVAESGKLFIFSDVDGATLTLPDSGGGDIIGTYYDFFVGISATSNAHKVVCEDTTNEKMWGNLFRIDTDTSDNLVADPALVGDSYSAISMNGTTTGILGSWFRVINMRADRWFVQGTLLQNGSVATAWATS